MSSAIERLYEEATASGVDRAKAVTLLEKCVALPVEEDQVDDLRTKEAAVTRLCECYVVTKEAQKLRDLLFGVRSLFEMLPKAKTAKLMRKIFDQMLSAGATLETLIATCKELIEWTKEQKQTFLRLRLQHRLATLLHSRGDAADALGVITPLLKEVRRLEDRNMLVDAHLLESKVYHSIKNHTKARAALVAARTNANSIYCPPLQQAEIDMQSGILNAEDGDNKTAFSYLYEAFEGYHSLGDHSVEARRAMKYMVLAKILSDNGDELRALLQSKSVLQYHGADLNALKEYANAYKKKDTHLFNAVRDQSRDALGDDPVVVRHLEDMSNRLIESHLLRVVEPYQRVQIDFLAKALKLPASSIEARLSQMILDKKLAGIVDQQHMCLVLFEEEHPTELYTSAIKTLEGLDGLVNSLFDKVSGKYDRMIEEQKKAEEAKKAKEAEKATGGSADKKDTDSKKESK